MRTALEAGTGVTTVSPMMTLCSQQKSMLRSSVGSDTKVPLRVSWLIRQKPPTPENLSKTPLIHTRKMSSHIERGDFDADLLSGFTLGVSCCGAVAGGCVCGWLFVGGSLWVALCGWLFVGGCLWVALCGWLLWVAVCGWWRKWWCGRRVLKLERSFLP